jgi:hypothetical protein
MTKLNEKQSLNLALVSSADTRWRDAKRGTEAEVRREIRERTQHLLDERNEATLIAHSSGVPKVQIAQIGLGVKNTISVTDAIVAARARRFIGQSVTAQQFARGEAEGEIVVSLAGADLNEACALHDWRVDEALAAGVTNATFRATVSGKGSQLVLTAATPSFVDESGKPHPVVAWGRAHSAEILQWWMDAVS